MIGSGSGTVHCLTAGSALCLLGDISDPRLENTRGISQALSTEPRAKGFAVYGDTFSGDLGLSWTHVFHQHMNIASAIAQRMASAMSI